MLSKAKISFSKMKKNILIFGIINCAFYIILFFAFKYLNFKNITNLRVINYAALTLISLFQIHSLIKQKNGYIPFLESFLLIFCTGTWSFMLFSGFIYIYSWCDPYLHELFIMDSSAQNKLVAAMLVFFEGSGGSIIIALIAMFYSGMYQDGEASV
jgi:hypothetical protein